MRRLIIPFVLLVGVLTLAASGLADPGDKGKGKAQGKNKFSFSSRRPTVAATGREPWATLTEKRTYQMHKNKDGTYRLRRVDKGTFTTVAGNSPGNCPANKSKHGQLIRAGVTGRFGGYLEGTITGGTFNKNATCAASRASRLTSSRRSSVPAGASRATARRTALTASSTTTTPRRAVQKSAEVDRAPLAGQGERLGHDAQGALQGRHRQLVASGGIRGVEKSPPHRRALLFH